jgi:hypothetical protein
MLVRRKYAFELKEKVGNGLNIRLKLERMSYCNYYAVTQRLLQRSSSVLTNKSYTNVDTLWFVNP